MRWHRAEAIAKATLLKLQLDAAQLARSPGAAIGGIDYDKLVAEALTEAISVGAKEMLLAAIAAAAAAADQRSQELEATKDRELEFCAVEVREVARRIRAAAPGVAELVAVPNREVTALRRLLLVVAENTWSPEWKQRLREAVAAAQASQRPVPASSPAPSPGEPT